MIVGITTWGDRVSPVLDAAERLVIFRSGPCAGERRAVDLSGRCAGGERAVDLSGLSVWQRAAAIEAAGVDVLICGAVTTRLLGALTGSGVTVVPWVSGPVSEILQAFSCGRLDERFSMPGCGRGRRRSRRGR